VVNGNDPTRYADVGISKDKEHMEQFYRRFYGENAVRTLEYPIRRIGASSVQDGF